MSHSQFDKDSKHDTKTAAQAAAPDVDHSKDNSTPSSVDHYALQEISASLLNYQSHLINIAKNEMALINQAVMKKQTYKIKIPKADAKLATELPPDKKMQGTHEALKPKQFVETELVATESLDKTILNFDAKPLDFDTLIRETGSLGNLGKKLLAVIKVLALVSGLLDVMKPDKTISPQQQIILLKTILKKSAYEFAKQPQRDTKINVLNIPENIFIKMATEQNGIDLAYYGVFEQNVTVANLIKHFKTPTMESDKVITTITAMMTQAEKLNSSSDHLMPLLKIPHRHKKNIHHHAHPDHKKAGMTLFAKLTKPAFAIQQVESALKHEIKQFHEPIDRLKLQIEKYKKDITEKSIIRDEAEFNRYCNKKKIIGKGKRNKLEVEFRAALKEAHEKMPGLESQLNAESKSIDAKIQKSKADAKNLEIKVTAINDLHVAAAELNKDLLEYVQHLQKESLSILKKNKHIYSEFMISYEGDIHKLDKDFFGNVSDSDSDDENTDSKSFKKRVAIGKDFEIVQEKLKIMSELCQILKKIETRTLLTKILSHNNPILIKEFDDKMNQLLTNKKGLLEKYKQLSLVFSQPDEKHQSAAEPSSHPQRFLSQKRRFSFTAAKGENIVNKIIGFKTLMHGALLKAGISQEATADIKNDNPKTPNSGFSPSG
jgi:hypothetical protein